MGLLTRRGCAFAVGMLREKKRYATHIFDNLEDWPTHMLYISRNRVEKFCRIEELTE